MEHEVSEESWSVHNMGSKDGEQVSESQEFGVLKRPRSRRVFINGELHHLIHINLQADIVTAYSFKQDKVFRYPWKATKKVMERAYSIGDVAKMVHRHPDRIRHGLSIGEIPEPQRTGPRGRRYFSPEDVLNIQDYFANVHFGRPRNDGAITPRKNTPTKEEVDARLGRREVLYVKNNDGEFIPIWRTVEF